MKKGKKLAFDYIEIKQSIFIFTKNKNKYNINTNNNNNKHNKIIKESIESSPFFL